MTEKFRQHPENPKQNAPEAGAGPIGLPPPSLERQPLPNVWDVLERRVRLNAPDVEDHPRGKEYDLQQREVNWLIYDLKTEKGSDRDKLIIGLFNNIAIQPGEYGSSERDLLLEEFQQLRSKVETMSDEEITEEIRKQKEEHKRKIEEARNNGKILTLELATLAQRQPSFPDHFFDPDIDGNDN